MKNQLLQKFHSSLSKINWKKLGLTALYIMLGLVSGGILTLLAGVVFVGHPTMPARQNPANMVITLVLFLGAGLAIYTFRGGGRRKK